MMLSKKTFGYAHKLALFAITFASLAPGISRALAAQQGVNTFTQQICTSDGRVITIQGVKTKGWQLQTRLNIGKTGKQIPACIVLHLDHCPYCTSHSLDHAVIVPHPSMIANLVGQAEMLVVRRQSTIPVFLVRPPPAQAPPWV